MTQWFQFIIKVPDKYRSDIWCCSSGEIQLFHSFSSPSKFNPSAKVHMLLNSDVLSWWTLVETIRFGLGYDPLLV